MDKLWEYLKEPARWVAIAAVAWAIDVVVPTMKPEYIPYVMIVLRFLDKWLYDVGKIVDSKTVKAGLVRF
jgi:hypothetical protein